MDYVAAAILHRDNSLDPQTTNAAHDKLISIFQKMRELPDFGEGSLRRLMSCGDDRVSCWAALHLLPLAPKDAEITLTRIALGPKSLLEFSAAMILKEWKRGSLKIAGDPLPLYNTQS